METKKTLDFLLEHILDEGVTPGKFSTNERAYIRMLCKLRNENYDDFIVYFIRYKTTRKWLLADYYD